jgi:hypothetical protein
MIVVDDRIAYCQEKPGACANLSVEEHQKRGKFEWNKAKQSSALYVSRRQKQGERITGDELRTELEGMQLLNACILEYLFVNQDLIPQGWKDKVVSFWGTIYRGSEGRLCVRCLYWDGRFWHCDHCWLDQEWSSNNVVALHTG